ncbi:hypothetical protein [Peribacillus frigoritolerans]|uniref:hypothetical protein n=1 Tax=Peribacillus frigoritolerans TaxID=450367 RepID=UPI003F7DFBD7
MKSIMKLCGKLACVLVGIARNDSAYKSDRYKKTVFDILGIVYEKTVKHRQVA